LPPKPEPAQKSAAEKTGEGPNIVSLDQFRKK